MRNILIIGTALALAAPAAAQRVEVPQPVFDREIAAEDERAYDGYAVDDRDGEDGAPLLDPQSVSDVAQRMDRLVGAVMDLPVGPIVAAVDPEGRGDYRRGDTVRDFATRDDPEAEARIRGGIHASTAGIGAMSQALTQMMPVLRRSMEEMERSMDRALSAYRRD